MNDQAQIWGGGFAKQVRKKWPEAQAHFRQWTYGRQNLKLGNVHTVGLRDDLTLVSLVAQHGFGKATSGPRLNTEPFFSVRKGSRSRKHAGRVNSYATNWNR